MLIPYIKIIIHRIHHGRKKKKPVYQAESTREGEHNEA